MKTLMIGLTKTEGGSQRHIIELRKRIECDVLTMKEDITFVSELWANLSFAIAVYFWSLRLMFGKKAYDIIHIHENLLYGLAPLLGWRYKIVITVHGLKGFKFYDNKFLWFFFNHALFFADRLIAVNLEDEKILNNAGLGRGHISYIPNGVDLSAYKHISPLIEKRIVYIGRIHKQKGIKYLLEAFCLIDDDRFKLEIIGDINNDYAGSLQEYYKGTPNITWRGSIKGRREIVRSLKSAYMIVLPSLWEGLPLTLFEGLASGRPMILSDIPAFKSIIKNEALFFSSKNASDLKEKIIKLIKHKNLASSLGKKGKELAKQYDWNVIAEQTKRVYKE